MVENIEESIKHNADHLAQELKWLDQMISFRMSEYFGKSEESDQIESVPEAPSFDMSESVYSRFIQMYELSTLERLALILSLAPSLMPSLLDDFFIKDKEKGKSFTCFGGAPAINHSGFLPTGETFLFIAAGHDLSLRFQLLGIFGPDHVFAKHGVIDLEPANRNEPYMSGPIVISREFIDLFSHGKYAKPTYGQNFPAKELTTTHTWDDLVLDNKTLDEIHELKIWVEHGKTLMEDWGMKRKLKPGYLTLFHGPPGTGKTLTASLIAKLVDKPLYRIDLSLIVSKYIGETEKNLSTIFDQAENKNWILFFDEADALFGKRTKVSDAHDRYANQEVSYLLQRVEDFSGLVILASNLKANMDEAFVRRFQSIIYFPLPTTEQRHILWQKSFSPASSLEEEIDLYAIADKFELSGGAIMNIVRYASLRAISRASLTILKSELMEGIRREFRKDGKLV